MSLPGPRLVAPVLVSLSRNAPETLRDLNRSYGPVVKLGHGPIVYVALFGREANRRILDDERDNFLWGEAFDFLRVIDGDTALIMTDGPDHDRRRRLVQPAFSPQASRRYFDLMVEEVDREIDTWHSDDEVDVFASMRMAIRRTLVRSLFGDSLGERADELGAELTACIDFVNKPIWRQVRIGIPGTGWRRAIAARDAADTIVNAEIARRRLEGSADEDLLAALLGANDGGSPLTDVEIRDQVVSLFAAGSGTTSAVTGWLVHELLNGDGEWQRAADEIDGHAGDAALSPEILDRCQHLDNVLHETLRLWPPGFVGPRKVVDDFHYEGHLIPAGTTILYSSYVTHRLPELWPDPDRFLPDRWIDFTPDPWAYLPFGGVYRRCVGFPFATQLLKVLIAQVLVRARLESLRATATPTGQVGLRPKGGVPARVISVAPARSSDERRASPSQ